MQRHVLSRTGRTSHPAQPSNDWQYASLLNIITRHALFRPADHNEITRLLKGECGIRNPLLAYVGLVRGQNEVLLSLMKLMGCPQPEALDRVCGAELLSQDEQNAPYGSEHHQIFSTKLRYCRICIGLGYHSMLYQHWAIDRCPAHRISFLDTCPSCGLRMAPTIHAILSKPFCCPHCEHLLFKTVASPNGEEVCREIDRQVERRWREMALYRRQALTRVTVTSHLLPAMLDGHPSAQYTRTLQRATTWISQPAPCSPRFREQSAEVTSQPVDPVVAGVRSSFSGIARHAAGMLNWLRIECDVPIDESSALLINAWQRIQYISPKQQDHRVSAIAAALHLTMTQYGAFPVNFRVLHARPIAMQPYVGVRWNGLHASSTPLHYGSGSGLLVAMEILGYFALSLLRCAGLRPLDHPVEIEAHASFNDYSYCPFWRVEGAGRNWRMRVRPRVTERLVRRLIWRYRKLSLQRLVQCSTPTGPTTPPSEAFSQSSCFPFELLHFPHGEVAIATEEGLARSQIITSYPVGLRRWRN